MNGINAVEMLSDKDDFTFQPSISGFIISQMIKSEVISLANCIPDFPLWAEKTWYPSFSRISINNSLSD